MSVGPLVKKKRERFMTVGPSARLFIGMYIYTLYQGRYLRGVPVPRNIPQLLLLCIDVRHLRLDRADLNFAS